MARPCNSVDPEEHYRRLERLLTELYLVLRTLLAQGAPLLPPAQHQPPQPPPPQDPSGSGQRRRRGGRSRCSERPAGGSNHQNEPDDHPEGSFGGGQQNQRKCALATRISSEKEGNWDAIGLGLKLVADNLDPDFSKYSPNITGLFEVLSTLFATFFNVKSSSSRSGQSQRNKLRERQKT